MQKVLLQARPARDWREASPLGNGRLGALVHGRASDERVALNHEALFNWAVHGGLPDLAPLLPEVRRLLAEGRFAEAEKLYPDALKAAGGLGRSGKFFPAFDLRLRCGTDGAFRDYSRELDLENGVSTVRWTDDGGTWARVAFVDCSRGADGPLVLRVDRVGAPFSLALSLPQHDLLDYPGYGGWDSFSTEARGRAVLSTVKTNDGLHFSGCVRVLATNGAVLPCPDAETAIASRRDSGRKPIRPATAAARPGGIGFRPDLASGGNASPHSREAACDAGSVSAKMALRSKRGSNDRLIRTGMVPPGDPHL